MWVSHFAPALAARPYTETTLPVLAFATQLPALLASVWNTGHGRTMWTVVDGGLRVAPVSALTNSLVGISSVGALAAGAHLLSTGSVKNALTLFLVTVAPFGLDLMLRDDMAVFPPQNRAVILKQSHPTTYHVFAAIPLIISALMYISSLPSGTPRRTATVTLPVVLATLYGLATFFHVNPDVKGLAWMGVLAPAVYYFRVLERCAAGVESVTIPVPKADVAPTEAPTATQTAKQYISSASTATQSGLDKAKSVASTAPIKTTAQSGMQKARDLISTSSSSAASSVAQTAQTVTLKAKTLVSTVATVDPKVGVQKAREFVGVKFGAAKKATVGHATPQKVEYAGDGKWHVVKGDVDEGAAKERVGEIAAALG